MRGGPLREARAPTRTASIDRGALTDEQLGALEAAFAHRLSVITGGPGTGKTSSIRTIAAEAAARGARVMLVAPTGRAAVRMSETGGGLTARTVHSALGWIPGEGPTRDEDDPLGCELLIVDETSMANLELLVVLLRAVGPDTHVVLVGDADQLAPVGAGKPFAELVASRGGADDAADPHLPPGGRLDDRPGGARDPPRHRPRVPSPPTGCAATCS